MKQTPIHELHNNDLLEMIPPNLRSIIEIGSSSGAMAREYKKRYPHARYIGHEIDVQYAEKSQRYCDAVFVGDIENMAQDFWQKNQGHDCWVFADVLEHLKDPVSVLRRVHDSLPPSGCIAACIPNMQHWTVTVELISGELHYVDAGLLDRTHLRWFTRKSILRLFAETGYRIEIFKPRDIFQSPDYDLFLPLLQRIAHRMGVTAAETAQDTCAIQYCVLAYKV